MFFRTFKQGSDSRLNILFLNTRYEEGEKHSATFADLDAFEQQCPLIHVN